MKKLTSVTIWNDAVGLCLAMTHSVIDPTTHKVTKDNVRTNAILSDDSEIDTAQAMMRLAQNILNAQED